MRDAATRSTPLVVPLVGAADFCFLPLGRGSSSSCGPPAAEADEPRGASSVDFSPLSLARVAAAWTLTALKGVVLGTMSSRNSRLSLWATVLAVLGVGVVSEVEDGGVGFRWLTQVFILDISAWFAV